MLLNKQTSLNLNLSVDNKSVVASDKKTVK